MNYSFNTYESTRIYLALGTFSTILAGFTNIFLKKKLKIVPRILLSTVILSLIFSTLLYYKYTFSIPNQSNYDNKYLEYLAIFYTFILIILLLISLTLTFF